MVTLTIYFLVFERSEGEASLIEVSPSFFFISLRIHTLHLLLR